MSDHQNSFKLEMGGSNFNVNEREWKRVVDYRASCMQFTQVSGGYEERERSGSLREDRSADPLLYEPIQS